MNVQDLSINAKFNVLSTKEWHLNEQKASWSFDDDAYTFKMIQGTQNEENKFRRNFQSIEILFYKMAETSPNFRDFFGSIENLSEATTGQNNSHFSKVKSDVFQLPMLSNG